MSTSTAPQNSPQADPDGQHPRDTNRDNRSHAPNSRAPTQKWFGARNFKILLLVACFAYFGHNRSAVRAIPWRWRNSAILRALNRSVRQGLANVTAVERLTASTSVRASGRSASFKVCLLCVQYTPERFLCIPVGNSVLCQMESENRAKRWK